MEIELNRIEGNLNSVHAHLPKSLIESASKISKTQTTIRIESLCDEMLLLA